MRSVCRSLCTGQVKGVGSPPARPLIHTWPAPAASLALPCPALQAALAALGCPQWEVRNSAMLCFTALTTRALGFKNESKTMCCKKSLTSKAAQPGSRC